MLIQTCPRCQFRLAPSKHICSTCGHSLAAKREVKENPASKVAEVAKVATTADAKVAGNAKKGFWKSLFTAPDETAAQDSRHDEPALET